MENIDLYVYTVVYRSILRLGLMYPHHLKHYYDHLMQQIAQAHRMRAQYDIIYT